MIDLLKTMIEASKAATLPLDMRVVYSGFSCCLLGDVAVCNNPVFDNNAVNALEIAEELAEDFAMSLESRSIEVFGCYYIAASIHLGTHNVRHEYAEESNVFTKEELQHPHLTTDHSDRAIAIDYIEMVIRKCEERLDV